MLLETKYNIGDHVWQISYSWDSIPSSLVCGIVDGLFPRVTEKNKVTFTYTYTIRQRAWLNNVFELNDIKLEDVPSDAAPGPIYFSAEDSSIFNSKEDAINIILGKLNEVKALRLEQRREFLLEGIESLKKLLETVPTELAEKEEELNKINEALGELKKEE